MSKRPRVLLVYKKDAYQQYLQEQQDPHLLRLLRRRHLDAMELQRAHAVHEKAMAAVLHALRRRGVGASVLSSACIAIRV